LQTLIGINGQTMVCEGFVRWMPMAGDHEGVE
jgi:hypothetical protein